jgi:hypothetical protein
MVKGPAMPGLFYVTEKKGTIARRVNGWKGDVGEIGNGCAKSAAAGIQSSAHTGNRFRIGARFASPTLRRTVLKRRVPRLILAPHF